LIPLRPLRWVQRCRSCNGIFHVGANDAPLADEDILGRCIRRLRLLLALSNEVSTSWSFDSSYRAYRILSGETTDETVTEGDVRWIQQKLLRATLPAPPVTPSQWPSIGTLIETELQPDAVLRLADEIMIEVAPYVDDQGKDAILSNVFAQAAEDGVFRKSEERVIESGMRILRVPRSRVSAIFRRSEWW
jgi:hypothetical protein